MPMIEGRWRGPGKANEFILYPQFILQPYLPTNEMLRTIFSIVLWCTWIMMLKLQMLEAVLPAIDSSSSPSLRCEELFWSYLQGPFVAMWTNLRAKPGKRQQSRWKDLISSHSSLCFPVWIMRLFNGLQNSIRILSFSFSVPVPPLPVWHLLNLWSLIAPITTSLFLLNCFKGYFLILYLCR